MQPIAPLMFQQMMAQSQPMLQQQQQPLVPLQTMMPHAMMPAPIMQQAAMMPHAMMPAPMMQQPAMMQQPMMTYPMMANSPDDCERRNKYNKSDTALLANSASYFGKLPKSRLQQVLERVGVDATLTADLAVLPILKMV